jgi:hypothetical protein
VAGNDEKMHGEGFFLGSVRGTISGLLPANFGEINPNAFTIVNLF